MKEYVTTYRSLEIDPKTGKEVVRKKKRTIFQYDEEERISIVKDYLQGESSAEIVAEKYHINGTERLFSWVGQYAKAIQSLSLQKETDSDMANKSKDQQIRELKEKLQQAEKRADMEALRAQAFSKMIDVAEQTFNIPIRKKSGTKQ